LTPRNTTQRQGTSPATVRNTNTWRELYYALKREAVVYPAYRVARPHRGDCLAATGLLTLTGAGWHTMDGPEANGIGSPAALPPPPACTASAACVWVHVCFSGHPGGREAAELEKQDRDGTKHRQRQRATRRREVCVVWEDSHRSLRRRRHAHREPLDVRGRRVAVFGVPAARGGPVRQRGLARGVRHRDAAGGQLQRAPLLCAIQRLLLHQAPFGSAPPSA
jgi:hypothetical protein